ncbi:carbon-nitrogen hydrolase family protein [Peijinzhouia sedimentorum]
MKALKYIVFSIASIILIWVAWVQIDLSDQPELSLELDNEIYFQDFPLDSAEGYIIGIQPIMATTDFATEENYFTKLDNYLDEANKKNWLKENTIVLFPEYIGTWLVVANQRNSINQSNSISTAMIKLIASKPFQFLKYWSKAQAENKVNEAIFSMEAEKMAGIYQRTFSKLAVKYKVSIVAGSIVLPNPSVEKETLKISKAPLQNISAWFYPDGKIDNNLIRKVFPIEEELSFTQAGNLAEIPVFETAIGNVASVICADSWYPEIYKTLKEKQVNILLVPSYSSPNEMWNRPWNGYNGSTTPSDVNQSDIGQLTEQEAWEKYSMLGRSQSANIAYGINTFLHGKLWDMTAAGDVFVIQDYEKTRIPSHNSSMIVRIAIKK